MKILLQSKYRPLVWLSSYFILGIIGGSIWYNNPYTALLLFLCSIVPIAFMLKKTGSLKWVYLIVFLGLGLVHFYSHPVVVEKEEEGTSLSISGEVQSVSDTGYQITLLLRDVYKVTDNGIKKLHTKLNVRTTLGGNYEVGDLIYVNGSVEPEPKAMNPSDMDYSAYLTSQNIAMTIDASDIKVVGHTPSLRQSIIEVVALQIDKVFEGRDNGIIKTLLIADGEDLEEDLASMYYTLGIGHVLAISGLHIGVLFGCIWCLLGFMGIPYSYRIISALGGVWCYAYMIGYSVSAMRACIILTLIYTGRLLFEEEDILIAMAVAAMIILIYNPFQLFQVGFQLSFIAYGAVFGLGECRKMCRRQGRGVRDKVLFLGGTICLSLAIAPVLAWHFYEVPALAVLLNWIVVPVYSLLMPMSLAVIIASFIVLDFCIFIGYGITFVLDAINRLGYGMNQMPFATIVVGRPHFLEIVLFYGLLILGIAYVVTRKYSYHLIGLVTVASMVHIMAMYTNKNTLLVTHLYVGQGDSTVIITPNKQVLLIDGGSYGKAETVEQYIHYKGYDTIDIAIVSHAHEDHVGGVIGLLDRDFNIEQVMMPTMHDEGEWEIHLQQLCNEKAIAYRVIEGNETLLFDEVSLKFLLNPNDVYDANDLSALCLLTYNNYGHLFTGDITVESESALMEQLPEVTVLKVAHHGSKTSSSEKFLEQIQPRYGMISCGIDNRYGHPHNDVLERLKSMSIIPLRTDREGATKFVTDGEKLSVISHTQEE